MSSGYLELFIDQGESFSANIELSAINKSAYNLSTYSAQCDLKKSYWSENTTASFNTQILNDGVNGIIHLSMNANTTQSLSSSRYVYDLFITNPLDTDNRKKVLSGIVYVEPSVTRI